eukprot:UN05633
MVVLDLSFSQEMFSLFFWSFIGCGCGWFFFGMISAVALINSDLSFSLIFLISTTIAIINVLIVLLKLTETSNVMDEVHGPYPCEPNFNLQLKSKEIQCQTQQGLATTSSIIKQRNR